MRHLTFSVVLTLGLSQSFAAVPRAQTQARPSPLLPPAQLRAAMADVRRVEAFVKAAERRLDELDVKSALSSWDYATNITPENEKRAAEDQRISAAEGLRLAKQAAKYEGLPLPPDLKRKLLFLKLTTPIPSDPKEQKEYAELGVELEGMYAKGKYCRTPETCMTLEDMEQRFRESRDPKELLELWLGWHKVAPPMRPKYARFVELSNKGAKELGFADTADLWRAGYDMTPAQFELEVDRLWQQLRPLYESLHAYVRRRLIEKYGKEAIGEDGKIPAHLLGNMWAQSWDNIADIAASGSSKPAFDLDEALKAKGYDELKMVRTGEAFFTSLGLPALPKTFWERSMITRPAGREVVCHASAWDVVSGDDVRIKMCTRVNAEDFVTIHHELGHNYYQYAYRKRPFLFRNSANDGFHEAVGDTISLAITPEYLKRIGLIEKVPGPEGDVDLLLKMAMERLAFQPFGLLVDKWRWQVFSGQVKPEDYNAAWWKLREKYQGVKAPAPRGPEAFDPGAKYHIPANVPYARYFLSTVLQFQLYRDFCRQAGHTGPLHACTFYGDKEVGAKLHKMMELGQSRPWPEALKAATGSEHMDATAVLEYFAPLKEWLDKQNKGHKVGWD